MSGFLPITKEEMDGVKHYLIDVLEPTKDFNVATFKEMAVAAMKEIYSKGKIPIITGGTGFYIQAVLYDIDFTQTDEDTQLREELEQIAGQKGAEYLHQMLRECDPKSAEMIHANNVKRVIRALEFYHLSGGKISEHNEKERQKESPYHFAYFVLNDERERLYRRINQRVDIMLEQGLVEEVKKLKDMGYHKKMVSMQGLGYKEILDYLEGECTLEEAIYRIKRDTRHFAKRQLTWFRREREVLWVNKPDFQYNNDKMLDYIIAELEKKQILV